MPGTNAGPCSALDAAAEANHRIANHLASLLALTQMEAKRLRKGPETVRREDAVAATEALASKIVAVAALHRALATDATAALDLDRLLREMLRPLKDIYGERLQIALDIGRGCAVPGNRASALAMAFAEIVTNAMKHAHPTGLPVEMTVTGGATEDGGIAIEIADDGVGLPDGFEADRDGGVGLRMVHHMVEQAGGRLATRSDPLGLTLSIALPPQG